MQKKELISIGKDNFDLDPKTVEKILCFILNISSKDLFKIDEIEEIYLSQIYFVFEKLKNGFPIEYLVKSCEFYGNDFYIDENCLIPRIDTEILVDETLNFLKNNSSKKFHLLDIGTGSGNIIISILKNFDKNVIEAMGIDIDLGSIKCAKRNNFFEKKLNFQQADFYNFDFDIFYKKNLLIVANLPYIKNGDYKNMSKNVIDFERSSALFGGEKTGFEMYENLVNILLKKSEIFESLTLFIEIGFDQFEISSDFLNSKGLKFEFFKDTNKIDRVIKIIF